MENFTLPQKQLLFLFFLLQFSFTSFSQSTITYANIQFPVTNETSEYGDEFMVYARVYRSGTTDSAGNENDIQAWIGYSFVAPTAVGDFASADWTWVPAGYNATFGNDYEYSANIGFAFPNPASVGTYYYVSRFQYLSETDYVYGGTNNGLWDGVTHNELELTLTDPQLDFWNFEDSNPQPSTVAGSYGEVTVSYGDPVEFFGQVYEDRVTDQAVSSDPPIAPSPLDPFGNGQGPGVEAWIGFSTVDATTAADFTSSDWTWIPANYNPLCGGNCGSPENNDEYYVDISPYLPGSGTYYVVTRFQYYGGSYKYGGYNFTGSIGSGGDWNNPHDGNNTGNYSLKLIVDKNCSSSTTWSVSGWDNGIPDIDTAVVINNDYDTAMDGNIIACSLTVNTGATLTIDDNTYVEVKNDVTVDGTLVVQTSGSLVQHNNNATVTVNGMASVYKTTAFLNNWYEYTYWSSPMSDETIGTALFESNANRRFRFVAANFVDSYAEVNNDNSATLGQDDIDDDGNDWAWVSGATNMSLGVGYAATHSQVGFIGAGSSYTYSFEGTPNNGIISVPVERNDTETNDVNWNLIGNPYPCAIDVDLFFTENVYDATTNPSGTLEGAIYLWSQNTPPSDTANGNETYNFSTSDYATINLTGEVAGGDGITPSRFIPSGQGFFIGYSDSALASSGNAVFNNGMRVTGNNSQFFRMSNTNEPNKLTLNLTSNNGVFNQMLVGYVKGATNGCDGMVFDAPRNTSTGNAAIIYSIIENASRKFAIQGRSPKSLDLDEVIKLGFYNTIDVEETQYILSIANLEGDFMLNTPIYLVDNLLNIEHNLTQSDYAFTSQTGEFNDRFEIRFASTLSVNNEQLNPNELIVASSESGWDIYTSLQSNISKVTVFDLLGRELQNLNINNSTLVHLNTDFTSNSVYVLKIKLSNGLELSKKVLK